MIPTTVISLGGSIISPDRVDDMFLKQFYSLVMDFIATDGGNRLILVTGGGAPAREYQRAYRSVSSKPEDLRADWIGIAATRLNAELVRHIFSEECPDPVVNDPTAKISFTGRILVASGWKPGFSTDNDAVLLAERFSASQVINLSNIEQVYTDDPKKNPQAEPMDTINWKEFRKIVGDEWIPGKNVPFDPVAARHAEKVGLTVIFAAGKDIANLKNILEKKSFKGTIIRP
ncbi:MAG: UMP kinase [Spirochaetaceae bacterium]|nr:MAG: UMP kinase [Spirochaetaceae bacterium]